MRIVRSFVVAAPTLLALLAVSQIGAAQISTSQIENTRVAGPQADWPPYTRTVTITIESGAALAPALASYWQTSVVDFSTNDRSTWLVVLPSDASNVTATVTGGTCQIGNTIEFSFTDSVADFAWSYRTSQKVLRQGNQYLVDQYASDNRGPFDYISTVFFTAPYQYVGQIGPDPKAATITSTVHWDEYVPLNGPDLKHIFWSSMWLVDPGLPKPDLRITAGTAYAQPGSPLVRVTAKIQNGSTFTTGAPVYVNIYQRRTISGTPSGPLDLAGGWCGRNLLGRPDCPYFDSKVGITNVLTIIGPGQIVPLTAVLTLTQSGLWDIWLQADVFGGPTGLNLESDENNNVKSLVGGPFSLYLTYLPLIVKEH